MGEKLVKALRQCRKNGNCDTCEYNTGDNADCIDTMMAEATDELEAADKRIAELEAQLSESQRREQAAVEDLKRFSACCQCNANIDGSCCDMFDGTAENKYFCSNWQWRGPQEAWQ